MMGNDVLTAFAMMLRTLSANALASEATLSSVASGATFPYWEKAFSLGGAEYHTAEPYITAK